NDDPGREGSQRDRGSVTDACLSARVDASPSQEMWAVVPCMGRWRFLEPTIASVLAHPSARYCLVDYACPDGAGREVERRYEERFARRELVVERIQGESFFNKSRAHNVGARRALREGARYLCFLDADTVVARGFWDYVASRVRPDRFLVAALGPHGADVPALTGLLRVEGRA